MDVVLFRVFLQPYICHHQSQVYPLTNRVTKWFHHIPSSPHCWSSSYLEVPPAPTRCNPTRRSWGWRTRYSPRSILIWRWGLWETDPLLSLVCREMRACCPQVECKCKSGQVGGQDGPGNLSCFANININTHWLVLHLSNCQSILCGNLICKFIINQI